MSSVITTDFEKWKAQQVAAGQPVVLDEFVFANVPNLDPAKTFSRDEKLPAASQIVHRQAVNKTGLASVNAVAYSVTLGTEVGHFDFNWIGLINKASGVIGMITHAPTQKKIKTANGLQGNVLTRSFLLEFEGAATETAITTTAETWQIDFTARLTGMDEMQRLINIDSYGEAAFFDDGFAVVRQGEQYVVKKGLAYVGGLRGELEFDQTLNSLRNTRVYADFSYQGNLVSQWKTAVKITVANELKNYVDVAGYPHYVFAIALIDENGNVTDLRSQGTLSDRDIAHLKQELGRVKQDYATNSALNAVNNNTHTRLEKAKNGADIPNTTTFVDNLGLRDTVNRAKNTWLKSESDDRYINASAIEIGSTMVLSDLAGKTGFYSRASQPIPFDSPLSSAFKMLTMGDAAWPTQMVYSSYENRAFIRTRAETGGKFRPWAEFLTDEQVMQSTGVSTTHVMSQKSVTDTLNTRLEKNKNGADIPNITAFVDNLGLRDTVKRAKNTWSKPESDDRYIQARTIEIGATAVLSDLAGNTGFYSRETKPLPSDSPLSSAFKMLTMGDAAWPTQMVYSSYENRAFIRTRTKANGSFREWAEFLTDNQLSQMKGTSTNHVMSQKAVTDALNTLNEAIRSRLPTAEFNELPFSFENVLIGRHGTDSPVTLRKSIKNRLIFLQHSHPGYTAMAYGVAGTRLEFKFGEYGYTAFDVSEDGITLSNWRLTAGYPVSGIFIVNGAA